MREKTKKIFGFIVIAIGVAIYLYPNIKEYMLHRQVKSLAKSFVQQEDNVISEVEDVSDAKTDSVSETNDNTAIPEEWQSLYQEMQEYNENLYSNGQTLVDAFSYSQPPDSIPSLNVDEAFGYIEIPDMDVSLPLYIGASKEHTSVGAAVMFQTSMPIGGENTNSVIVGHRGYYGGAFFRDIQNLTEGSMVYVTIPWDTLTYTVVSTDIIDPHDTEPILIQDGKDMITLLTCHPYLSSGYQRYIVYCERVQDNELNSVIADTSESAVSVDDSTDNLPTAQIISGEEDKMVLLERWAKLLVPIIIFMIVILIYIFRHFSKKGDVHIAKKEDD